MSAEQPHELATASVVETPAGASPDDSGDHGVVTTSGDAAVVGVPEGQDDHHGVASAGTGSNGASHGEMKERVVTLDRAGRKKTQWEIV